MQEAQPDGPTGLLGRYQQQHLHGCCGSREGLAASCDSCNSRESPLSVLGVTRGVTMRERLQCTENGVDQRPRTSP